MTDTIVESAAIEAAAGAVADIAATAGSVAAEAAREAAEREERIIQAAQTAAVASFEQRNELWQHLNTQHSEQLATLTATLESQQAEVQVLREQMEQRTAKLSELVTAVALLTPPPPESTPPEPPAAVVAGPPSPIEATLPPPALSKGKRRVSGWL